jgi:release factor glutamine methyltransferase
MTVDEYLKTTVAALSQAGVESARLDALILLEDALREDRAIILAHLERDIPTPLAAELYKKRTQREQHVPLAYIRGHAPFYGREFTVNEHVLVPRPETEAMIDLLKKLAPTGRHLRIADIGTGSGALGVTAALELPDTKVGLYDIDVTALAVARQNTQRHRVAATCARHDLLAGISTLHDILLANLPYVPEHVRLNKAAKHEPQQAIFSGPDGLDHYKRFWAQAEALPHKPGLIITESLPSRHHTNALLARAAGYYLVEHQGFAQAFQSMD